MISTVYALGSTGILAGRENTPHYSNDLLSLAMLEDQGLGEMDIDCFVTN